MKKQQIYLFSILLIGVTFYTYTFVPAKFKIEGGSCYQGITALICRFFLEICAILNLTALFSLFKSKVNRARTLSIISVVIWSLLTISHTVSENQEDFIIAIKYFAPFLIITILLIILCRIKKTEPLKS
ncbi:hypothetical protein [Flavobacterium pectinovorum]|uniref:DUF4293 family protein n=1 Tax=Flavobacterium pectinovorum TaxID=29533 RepID=A0ABY1J7I2_9FLAO|nr:hypothetical protein [Flavobacterium pectinovorum]SHN01724.1 hypothetical protein SAMN05444387_3821 [Flavobacterium pectinovorum]